MADENGVGRAGRDLEWSWREPLRRVVSRVLGEEAEPGGHALTKDEGASVVDCAVYLRGVRQPGRPYYGAALHQARDTADAFVWLGLHEPGPAMLTDLATAFGLHELMIRDALTADPRPRIERFGEVTVFVLRTTRYVEHSELTETSEVVETGAIVIFVGPKFVITVRRGSPEALAPVRAELEARGDLLAQGPWAVAHAVCDRLVDSYLEVSTGVEVDIDALEETVFAPGARGGVAHIYQLKRELMEFKRAVTPLQRPLAALVEDRELLAKEIRRYFRDVNDHLLRVVERVAAFDDLLNSILQARLAQVTVDQNNDMRKVASWAAIAAVQTAIAGVYGMNFTYMPELEWTYGYPAVVTVMGVAAVILYRLFRRSGWL